MLPPNWLDTFIDVAMSTTTTVTLLNGLTKGENYNSRHGREISLGSYEFNLQSAPTDTTGTEQNHRFFIVYDRYPQGVAPTFTDVFAFGHTSTNLDEDNRWRFRILYDSGTHTLSSRVAAGGGRDTGYLKTHKRIIGLKGLITRYNNGNAGTIADIDFGALFLMTVGSHAAGATAGTLYGTSRLRFIP